MSSSRHVPVLAVGVFLAACASPPTGPSVMVLPGGDASFEQFAGDDAVCQEWAARRIGITPKQAATQTGVTTAAIGTGVGAAAGAAIGAAVGEPGAGAAIGAGSGLLVGSSAGAAEGAWAGATVQERYDTAYLQCMYAKGHQIPVAAASVPAHAMGPPPPPPGRTPRQRPPPPPGPPPPPPPGSD